MPSPFPGMDPWLENVDVWHGVHTRMIAHSSDLLQSQAQERGFFVEVEERIYVEESERHVVPDLVVIESGVQVGETVVTNGQLGVTPGGKVLVEQPRDTNAPAKTTESGSK